VVITNFSKKRVDWAVPPEIVSILTGGKYLIGNYDGRDTTSFEENIIAINPFEAFVVLQDEPSYTI
jgi:hypothetical protein